MLPRRASFLARGRRLRLSSSALGTPAMESSPGPDGPRVCIMALEMDSSLAISPEDREGDDGEGLASETRSENWTSKGTWISVCSSIFCKSGKKKKERKGREFKEEGLEFLSSPWFGMTV